METDEILNYIYENAKMGKESTETLIKSLEGKENKIIEAVEDILISYADFENKAKELIATTELKEPKLIAKISANMGIKMKTKKDNSDANIADMLVQGLTMGELEMSKKIESFKDTVSKESLTLAKEFRTFQANAIEKLKKFL